MVLDMKLIADLDPVLYPAAAIAILYLLGYGLITWKRNNPDKWQMMLSRTGLHSSKRVS